MTDSDILDFSLPRDKVRDVILTLRHWLRGAGEGANATVVLCYPEAAERIRGAFSVDELDRIDVVLLDAPEEAVAV